MCKLLYVNNLKGRVTEDFLRRICTSMEKGQRDGIGIILEMDKAAYYAKAEALTDVMDCIISGGGSPRDFILQSCYTSNAISTIPAKGVRLSSVHTIAVHTRTSTNELGEMYAHPFDIEDRYLFMHNGIVNVPYGHEFNTLTDNDSEYLGHVFNLKRESMVQDIEGYYAFINYDRVDKKWTIGRDDTALLHLAEHSGGGLCIATSALDVKEVLNLLNTSSKIYRVKPFTSIEVGANNKISVRPLARPSAKPVNISKKLMNKSIGVPYSTKGGVR